MRVQYIYDEAGNRKSVIIPYKEWERIKESIKVPKIKAIDFDPDKFRGIYKHLKVDLEKEIKNLRDEWERIDI